MKATTFDSIDQFKEFHVSDFQGNCYVDLYHELDNMVDILNHDEDLHYLVEEESGHLGDGLEWWLEEGQMR